MGQVACHRASTSSQEVDERFAPHPGGLVERVDRRPARGGLMTATQRIAVHAIQDRRRAVPRPWVVRWTVDGKEHSRAFSHRVPADQYRAKLLAAVANAERFAVRSGEPTSRAQSRGAAVDLCRRAPRRHRNVQRPHRTDPHHIAAVAALTFAEQLGGDYAADTAACEIFQM